MFKKCVVGVFLLAIPAMAPASNKLVYSPADFGDYPVLFQLTDSHARIKLSFSFSNMTKDGRAMHGWVTDYTTETNVYSKEGGVLGPVEQVISFKKNEKGYVDMKREPLRKIKELSHNKDTFIFTNHISEGYPGHYSVLAENEVRCAYRFLDVAWTSRPKSVPFAKLGIYGSESTLNIKYYTYRTDDYEFTKFNVHSTIYFDAGNSVLHCIMPFKVKAEAAKNDPESFLSDILGSLNYVMHREYFLY